MSGFLSSQVHEAGTSKRMMAAHFLLQFLLFGTLLVPAYLQMEGCEFVKDLSVESNFSVNVTPKEYMANTSYQGKHLPSHCASSAAPHPVACKLFLDVLRTCVA